MKEQTLNLADIRKMQGRVSRKNKKIEIEKRNLAASLIIKANQNLNANTDRREIDNLKDKVREQIKTNQIPLDAYMAIFETRLKEMERRINFLEGKKADNGGVLRPGEESMLQTYIKAKNDLISDKEKIVADDKKAKEKPVEIKEPINGKDPECNTTQD